MYVSFGTGRQGRTENPFGDLKTPNVQNLMKTINTQTEEAQITPSPEAGGKPGYGIVQPHQTSDRESDRSRVIRLTAFLRMALLGALVYPSLGKPFHFCVARR